MAPRHLSLLALLVLTACEPIRIRPVPPVEPPAPTDAVLAPGGYVVAIEEVAALQCPGLAPRDIIGEQIGAELRVGEDEVVFDLGGWVLRGEMIPGAIFVEGGEEAVPVYEDDLPAEDEPREDEPRGDDDAEPVSSDSTEPDCGEDSGRPDDGVDDDDCGEEPGDPGDDRPPGGGETFFALDALIRDASHADGRLTVLSDGCSMELVVSVVAGEVDIPVVVGVDEDEDVDAGGGSDGCEGDCD